MKKLLSVALLATPVLGQAAVLDTRLSYDGVSKEYTQRVLVYNGWSNGIAGFIDIPFLLTKDRYSGEADSLRNVGTIELSAWWTTPLTSEFYLRPGMNLLIGPSGSTTRPSISVGYKPKPEVDSYIRYRYSRRNFSTTDNAGVLDRDDAHLVTIYAGWKFSPSLEFEYQGDLIKRINNYWNDNRKSFIMENELQVNFSNAFGKGVTPYMLIDHLGKSFKTSDGRETNHWRPRVGIKISF